MKQPQEIEVWYLLPTIRREIAELLTKRFNFKQKEAAEALGVTESAVSQYKEKRALKIKFSKEIKKQLESAAEKIAKNKGKALEEIQKICRICKEKKVLCGIHKKYDKIPKKCEACLR